MASLTPYFNEGISALLKSGRFNNESEVVRAALRLLFAAEQRGGDYALTEYGATPEEIAAFERRVDAEIEAERRAGTIVPYTGNLAALVLRDDDEAVPQRPARALRRGTRRRAARR